MALVQELAPTVQRMDEQIDSLQNLYTFEEEDAVREFLRTHPQLVVFLPEAYGQVQKYFGRNTEITLGIVHAYEDHAPDELFGYIQTELDVDQALDRLDKFSYGWFLEQFASVGEWFNFDVSCT